MGELGVEKGRERRGGEEVPLITTDFAWGGIPSLVFSWFLALGSIYFCRFSSCIPLFWGGIKVPLYLFHYAFEFLGAHINLAGLITLQVFDPTISFTCTMCEHSGKLSYLLFLLGFFLDLVCYSWNNRCRA